MDPSDGSHPFSNPIPFRINLLTLIPYESVSPSLSCFVLGLGLVGHVTRLGRGTERFERSNRTPRQWERLPRRRSGALPNPLRSQRKRSVHRLSTDRRIRRGTDREAQLSSSGTGAVGTKRARQEVVRSTWFLPLWQFPSGWHENSSVRRSTWHHFRTRRRSRDRLSERAQENENVSAWNSAFCSRIRPIFDSSFEEENVGRGLLRTKGLGSEIYVGEIETGGRPSIGASKSVRGALGSRASLKAR